MTQKFGMWYLQALLKLAYFPRKSVSWKWLQNVIPYWLFHNKILTGFLFWHLEVTTLITVGETPIVEFRGEGFAGYSHFWTESPLDKTLMSVVDEHLFPREENSFLITNHTHYLSKFILS